MPRFKSAPIVLMVLAVAVSPALARIKLITLPRRERVEIQLDQPNVTLVEEERVVPLLKGVNQVDFSWADTAIDKDSIQFRSLADPEGIKVLSVSYPPNENALVWQVSAGQSGPARVRISYIIGQLNKSFEYRATAAHDEKSLLLSQYVKLQNLANEDFGEAGLWAGFGDHFLRPIGINETKQILSARFADVPIQKTYTASLAEFAYLDEPQKKLRIPMHYLLKNDKEHKLGQFPLMPGKARIFQDDGKGGEAFVGEDWGKFTPMDDEMKLYLGVAKDIVVRRVIARNDRKVLAGNLANQEVVIQYEIENFKDSPVTLDVIELARAVRNETRGDTKRDVEWELGRETTFPGGLDPEKSTFDRLVFHIPLKPRAADGTAEKVVHKLHLMIKNEW
ncbi:MAG: hypothetical protein KA354_19640 [Phycisphaerae bacterium]|nr:hypothetical protein [Phycisphaerae bacterium]